MEYSSFSGFVLHGQKLATTHLVPTANLDPDIVSDLNFGLYFSRVEWNGDVYFGLLHYGLRSAADKQVSLEIHILDFDKNIYGQELRLQPLELMRDVREFSSLQDLQKQIKYDLIDSKKYVKKYS